MIIFCMDFDNFNLAFICVNGYLFVHCSLTTVSFRIRNSSESIITSSCDNSEFPTPSTSRAIEFALLQVFIIEHFEIELVFYIISVYKNKEN